MCLEEQEKTDAYSRPQANTAGLDLKLYGHLPHIKHGIYTASLNGLPLTLLHTPPRSLHLKDMD